MPGLGLLNVETTLSVEKTVTPTNAQHVVSGENIEAYEIHLGQTKGPDTHRPFALKQGQPEGPPIPPEISSAPICMAASPAMVSVIHS